VAAVQDEGVEGADGSETVEKHVNLLCLCLHVDHDIFVRCIGGIFVLELMPIAGLA
jgi:hypothetical protein